MKIGYFFLFFLFSIIVISNLSNASEREIVLNQYFIQEQAKNYHSETIGERLQTTISKISNVLKILEKSPTQEINPDDPESVLAYVFSRFPKYAIVYPTETYYYYQIETQKINLSGNIRLLDVDKGIIHMGYFDRERPRSQSFAKDFNETDGLIITKKSEGLYKIEYMGLTRIFRTPQYSKDLPDYYIHNPDEELVSPVYDESGIKFLLLFNNKTKSFKYVLDSRYKQSEELIKVDNSIYYANRTGFLFYNDEKNRLILIGVSSYNILSNNYYDGPFDQVPPRLEIKEKLNEAYPYTTLYEGIDENGNFLIPWQSGSRVAISPYQNYYEVGKIVNYYKECLKEKDGEEIIFCLTYEKKSEFHKKLENSSFIGKYEKLMDDASNFAEKTINNESKVHTTPSSQGWPANHQGDISREWSDKKSEHIYSMSITWPKNHQGAISREKSSYH